MNDIQNYGKRGLSPFNLSGILMPLFLMFFAGCAILSSDTKEFLSAAWLEKRTESALTPAR